MNFKSKIKNGPTIWCLAAVICCNVMGFSSHSIGQDRKEAAPNTGVINDLADSHPLSAYIERSTLVVVEIDWQKIDVDAFFKTCL